MNGGENKQSHTFGYTIVEVMIVLAITGVMFLIAAFFIQGKQGQVEFRQSVTNLSTKIASTINDVTNGFFPSGVPYACSSTAGSAPALTYSSSPPDQGSNDQCIFLGKVIQFDPQVCVGSPGVPTEQDNSFNIWSVAGARLDSSGNPVSDLVAAHPTAIYDTSAGTCGTPQFDATDRLQIEGGTTVSDIGEYQTSTSANPQNDHSYGFGVFTNLASDANTNGLLTSGAASIGLYDFDAGGSYINRNTSDSNVASQDIGGIQPSAIDKVVICLKNANHTAYITVGGEGKLTTDITWEQGCPF